jgi:glycosyltransferase involved in cell wall biosynthesis
MQVMLTVIIATHNEEANIGKCLESVRGLADEVIVADGESTDQTVQIAESTGAIVLHMTNKRMFHFNKEEARKRANGEWILFLDADELVTPSLKNEIRTVLDGSHTERPLTRQFEKHSRYIAMRDGVSFSQTAPINGYFIARKNFFLGRYLMHSGVYPDGVIRLVRQGKAYWPCKDVHETMKVDGGVSWLQEPMIHMADPTFSRYLQRANRYTTLTADELARKNVGTDVFTMFRYLVWLPSKMFFLLFFRHKGFMDGFSGFVWSLMSGIHYPIAYMKYRMMVSV